MTLYYIILYYIIRFGLFVVLVISGGASPSDVDCKRLRVLEVERTKGAACLADLRPISVLRFWISEV